MRDSRLVISTPSPVPHITNAEPSTQDLRAGLEALLAQVNALAIRLRQPGKHSATALAHLPAAEHAVLDILNTAGPMTVPDIARERCTSRQNIQILVDKLEAGGRVESVANPAHKRSALVRLTSEGTRWLVANAPGYRQFLSEIEAELAQSEIQSGLSLLRRIHKMLLREPNEDTKSRAAKRPAISTNRISPGNVEKGASEPAEEEFPVNLL